MLELSLKSLEEVNKDSLSEFLLGEERNLIYYSHNYLQLIQFITDSKCFIILAHDDSGLKGIFPFFKKVTDLGTVINSGPFYGSHGGSLSAHKSVAGMMIDYFLGFCKGQNVLTATVIPPFYEDHSYLYEQHFKPDFSSFRHSQCKRLPQPNGSISAANLEGILFDSIPSKTRNMIRKPMKAGVTVLKETSPETICFLKTTHEQNCLAIGIVAKKPLFFESIENFLKPGKDFKIYTANFEGEPIAGLLCLYHHKTVEYFVPAIVEAHRSVQPLSLLIFEAMKDAMIDGYMYWNWGGTSASAESVFRFKDSWGTVNREYFYYTNVLNEDVYKLSQIDIEKNMEYFFLIDYNKLKY